MYVFTEHDAGNNHANKPPLLPAPPEVKAWGHQGSLLRAPTPPPLLTSLLFFLKAQSLFFLSLAGQDI